MLDVGCRPDHDVLVPQISDKLKAKVDPRIKAMGYTTVTAFAAACGLTSQGILPLRKGEIRAYQPRLTIPVCRALGWTDDSIERMMRGEDPVEVESEAVSSELAELRRLVESIRTTLDVERTEAQRHGDAIARLADELQQLLDAMPPPGASDRRPSNAEH